MGRSVLQRLPLAVPVLPGVLLLGLVPLQVVPNDPAVIRAGPTAAQDVIESIRRELRLDRPPPGCAMRDVGSIRAPDLRSDTPPAVPAKPGGEG